MIDIEEFRKIFDPDNIDIVKKIFPEAETLQIKTIVWKDKKVTTYDYESFVKTIKTWIKENNWTKEQALDEWFSMV
jgi:hypothetical protein